MRTKEQLLQMFRNKHNDTRCKNLPDGFSDKSGPVLHPAFHVQDVLRVNPVRLTAPRISVKIHIFPRCECSGIVHPDLHALRIQRIQPLNFSVRQPIDIRIAVAEMIPAVFQIREKLNRRDVRIRPRLQEKCCIMVRYPVFIRIHQVDRHLTDRLGQCFQAGKIRDFRDIRTIARCIPGIKNSSLILLIEILSELFHAVRNALAVIFIRLNTFNPYHLLSCL